MRTVLLLMIVLGSFVTSSVADTTIPCRVDCWGGFDDIWSYWELLDYFGNPLEDGDYVYVAWTGPDKEIAPPGPTGCVTGDDLLLAPWEIFHGGFFISWFFYPYPVDRWQRGDLIYCRIFDGPKDSITVENYYGDSNLHMLLNVFEDYFFAKFPGDPGGGHTGTKIFMQFLKIIGGIDPATGQTFSMLDSAAILEDGSEVQLNWVGLDGKIDVPNPLTRMPGGDDVLLETWGVNEWESGPAPPASGIFRRITVSFDDSTHGRPAQGDQIYVRLFNSNNLLSATHYGDSPVYMVEHVIGESLSVFYDDRIDCDIPLPDTDARDFTIYGGLKATDMSYWPVVNARGLSLHDGDAVQLLWAGPDALRAEMDQLTGMPTGDDSLLAVWGIGEGYAGIGVGRFRYQLYTYEAHAKGGCPAQGDLIYLRVFDAPTIGEGSAVKWYGESDLYVVGWEFGEQFYSFPDSSFDATQCAPWYRTIKVYGGLDFAMAEYPLTDSAGVVLEDGDVAQLVWAGPDEAVNPIDQETCLPTGDDSLLATWEIGQRYVSGTGLLRKEIQTYSRHELGYPAGEDYVFVRLFNGPSYADATHYGESGLHRVAYEHGERFFCFSDSAADAVMPLPVTVVERNTDIGSQPKIFTLQQNYPNPFNAATEIEYIIPQSEHVILKVYNILGAEVTTLVDGRQGAGCYAVVWQAQDLASGIYFCCLRAGDRSETVKMMLLK